MKKHKYLKVYKPYFVRNDPIKKHLEMIYEATRNMCYISIPRMFEVSIRTERYGRLLQKEFIRISNLFKYSDFDTTISLMRFLDLQFEKYLIKFKFDSIVPDQEEQKCGITKMEISGKDKVIYIKCNTAFRKNFLSQNKELFNTFYDLICHELVHRGQLLLRRYKDSIIQMNKRSREELKIKTNDGLSEEEKTVLLYKRYLSDINEIMAYANQIVEELRFKGLSDKEIIQLIKGFKIPGDYSSGAKMYNDYFSVTNKDDYKVLKKLFTYIYGYVTGEEKHEFII